MSLTVTQAAARCTELLNAISATRTKYVSSTSAHPLLLTPTGSSVNDATTFNTLNEVVYAKITAALAAQNPPLQSIDDYVNNCIAQLPPAEATELQKVGPPFAIQLHW